MNFPNGILVTGASGFIGSALALHLHKSRLPVTTLSRGIVESLPSTIRQNQFMGFPSSDGLEAALDGVDVVVHCAARVHVMSDDEANASSAFREVNVDGTRRLAELAKKAGVKRFIFLSSVKVNGGESKNGLAYHSSDAPRPIDPYGASKHQAEEVLRQICSTSGMEPVIIRPVLVYGPGVKANFEQLVRVVSRGLPLPLSSVNNRRSIVALDNLVDLIATCITHPNARYQTFLVSDGHDLSTAELIREIARCLNKHPRLLPFPPSLLKLVATVVGQRPAAERLLGSLQVDISHTCKTLDWRPPVTTQEALQKTINAFSTGWERSHR